MGKKAVLIGCNYPGTKAELKGCINDVWRMYRCLVDRYGFSEDDITLLIDTDPSHTEPTGHNVRAALSDLIRSAEPGDSLFIKRLLTCFDSCTGLTFFCTDDDFRELVDQVPKGCRITIVSDSCHSGGLIDEAKEQIGESTRPAAAAADEGQRSSFGFRNLLHRKVDDALESRGIHLPSVLRHHQLDEEEAQVELGGGDQSYGKSRSLPLSTLIDILKQKTGKDDIDVGKLRPALFDIFGDDASPKVKKFMKVIMDKLQHQGDGQAGGGGFLGMVGSLAQEFLKQKLDENDEDYAKPALKTKVGSKQEVYAGASKRALSDNGILISGCQTDQTSADASPSGKSAEAYGALSNAIQTIIAESDGTVTNQELVLKAREMLKRQGYAQRPGLYCSDHHVDAPFVC
ncbi:hypothetical protein RJ639_044348 [Escallonia herrerae]|uniref:Peptidase C14 caspase domain-containing protein n=1 Tax=Escallonia herrerae TaxID=1293975 RepID=A0AA89B459_9ASTE|nr:hypothetical protein RJ639_044348 [Escallonia herrerae]